MHPRLNRVIVKFKIKFNFFGKNAVNIESNFCNLNLHINGTGNILKFSRTANLVDLRIEIKGNNNSVIIEDGVRISGGKIVVEDDNSTLLVGKNTTIESNVLIGLTESDQSITIGKDCMISENVQIRNGDSHSIIDLEDGQRINTAKSIIIGDHVWIGSNVTILKGSKICENSIIGIQSLVSGEITSNAIFAGIPAKKIRESVTWSRERTK